MHNTALFEALEGLDQKFISFRSRFELSQNIEKRYELDAEKNKKETSSKQEDNNFDAKNFLDSMQTKYTP